MKSWALGEELSTMRFTTLIRASALTHLRQRRNGRLRDAVPRGGLPHAPPGLPGDSGGRILLGPPAPSLLSPITRCELWVRDPH